ncbi:hypothetical protein [Magnetococcus sp. PR-3]|uniref:hypothetical protein n=1 Tax=Magnetococcus sp. PR-3 TaxID=3120355 RepID=UPI002FCE5DE2
MAKIADYPIVIKQKGDLFYLHQPELGILLQDPNITTLYSRYQQEAEARLTCYQALAMAAPEPDTPMTRKQQRRNHWQRHGLLALALLIPTILLASTLYQLPRQVALYLPEAAQQMITLGKESLTETAHTIRTMPPTEREALRQEVRATVQGLVPVVDEVTGLFQEHLFASTAAFTQMTPEKEEALRKRVRAVARGLAPVVQELRPLCEAKPQPKHP